MEIIKNIAAVVGCISACAGLIVTVFKPIRTTIIAGITHKQKEDETSKKLNQVSQDITILKSDIKNLNNKVEDVKDKVLENEADRLRSELFTCGNRCRRGIRVHPEEMDHVHAVFKKYSEVLKQNGTW